MQSPPLPPPPDQLGGMPAWAPAEAPVTPPYAGFWQRVAAYLIDLLVLLPVVLAVAWPTISRVIDEFERAVNDPNFDQQTFQREFIERFQGDVLVISLIMTAIAYLYAAVMVGQWNATVGKFALRIRVRKVDGTAAGWREALLRPLLQSGISLAGLVVPIGILGPIDYLWMLWDKQKQCLHDKIAGTIVVRLP